MRGFIPVTPRKDMDERDYRLFKSLNDYLIQVDAALAKVARRQTPDQQQEIPPTPPGIDDHGNLKGLIPVLNSDGSVVDYNDDHTQYPLIFGRPGGQYLYGSRPAGTSAWVPSGSFMAASSVTAGASVTYSNTFTAVVNQGIILVASSGFNPETGVGETNYHTSVTDTGGNTWTKLKEFTVRTGVGSSAKVVSLWFCLVTNALTAGVSTVTVNYSTSAMDRHACEAYQFKMQAGQSVVLASYGTNGTVAGNEVVPSLSLTGLTGEILFVRAMAIQPNVGTTGATYNQTANYTEFDDTHVGSTIDPVAHPLYFGFSVRGEFDILSIPGSTSSPTLATGDVYTTSSIFAALQISSNSNAVITLTPETSFTPIVGGFVTSINTTNATSWSSIAIQTSAPLGRLVFLVLATHSNGSGSGGGSTNYHTGLSDSQSNTWTKLKEFTTSFFSGTEEQTVSLWYSILGVTLSAGSDTLAATFSPTVAKKSIESYQFALSSAAVVSLSASTTGGLVDSLPEQLTLSGVTNPAIYIRAMAVHQTPGDNPSAYTSSAGYTPFTSDHTNSTNTSAETTFRNAAARGEFLLTTSALASNQPITSSALADTASVFCAVTVSSTGPPPNGYLLLGAANLADASRVILSGRDILFTAGIGAGKFKFDPLGQSGFVGILNFDNIAASDKTYTFPNTTGTVALTSDITTALAAYLPLAGGTMSGNIIFGASNLGDVYGASSNAKISYNGTDLLLNPSLVGTGAVNITPTINVSGSYAARQNVLKLAHSALSGGTTNTTAATVALGTGTATDAGLAATQFGMAQGLDLTVTNTNTTKAGNPKAAIGAYALTLALNGDWNVQPMISSAALNATAVYTNDPGPTALQAAIFASVSGTTTATAALFGIQACQFKANNATGGAGDARGFTGYGNLTNVAATGRGIGVFGFGALSGNSSTALAVSFLADTVAPPNDSRQHYDIIGQHIAIHGALWLTTTTNLKSSNPATHLTLVTANSIPAHDLFVSGQSEMDDTLWIDKVGDALVLAAGGNIALATTTGTKVGTGTTQKLGFWNAAPIVQPAALTAQLTTLTFTAPGTPDYAIADLTNVAPYGFVSQDEGRTTLSVIANLQTRVAQLEAALSAAGGGSGLIA